MVLEVHTNLGLSSGSASFVTQGKWLTSLSLGFLTCKRETRLIPPHLWLLPGCDEVKTPGPNSRLTGSSSSHYSTFKGR